MLEGDQYLIPVLFLLKQLVFCSLTACHFVVWIPKLTKMYNGTESYNIVC